MENKFPTKEVVLLAAVILIMVAAWMAPEFVLSHGKVDPISPLKTAAGTMPFWWPGAFIGYAIGARRLTVPMVIIFAFVEFASLGVQLSTFTFN